MPAHEVSAMTASEIGYWAQRLMAMQERSKRHA